MASERDGAETLLTEKPSILTKVDEVYERIGPMGRSQLLYFFCLGWMSVVALVNFVQGVFLLVTPEWRCIDEEMGCNSTAKLCDLDRNQWEWVNPDRTMVSYFELQCTMDKAFLAISLFFIPGCVIGLLLNGQLSDRFGRKKVMLSGLVLCMFCNIGQAFSASYPVYIAFRIFSGATFMMFQNTSLTYINEFFPGSKRPLCSFLRKICGWVGMWVLAGVYYFFPNWKAIPIANACLMLCGLIALIVPESPHWLLVNSGADAATAVLTKMARWNGCGKEVAGQIQLSAPDITKKEGGNIMMLLRNREYLVVSLQLFYQWFCVSILSYGFLYSLDKIAGDLVVNFLIMSSISIPFAVITSVVMAYIGRKKALILNLTVVILCCAIAMLRVDIGWGWTTERFAVVIGSKWGVISNWMVVTILTNEALPTSVRSTATSTGSIMARVGAFVAPFMVKHARATSFYLMYSIFIGVAVLGMALGWTIPETKDLHLRETITEEDKDGEVKC